MLSLQENLSKLANFNRRILELLKDGLTFVTLSGVAHTERENYRRKWLDLSRAKGEPKQPQIANGPTTVWRSWAGFRLAGNSGASMGQSVSASIHS